MRSLELELALAALVKPQAAAFEARRRPASEPAAHDATDSMLTKAPPPFAARTGANACVVETRPR